MKHWIWHIYLVYLAHVYLSKFESSTSNDMWALLIYGLKMCQIWVKQGKISVAFASSVVTINFSSSLLYFYLMYSLMIICLKNVLFFFRKYIKRTSFLSSMKYLKKKRAKNLKSTQCHRQRQHKQAMNISKKKSSQQWSKRSCIQ